MESESTSCLPTLKLQPARSGDTAGEATEVMRYRSCAITTANHCGASLSDCGKMALYCSPRPIGRLI